GVEKLKRQESPDLPVFHRLLSGEESPPLQRAHRVEHHLFGIWALILINGIFIEHEVPRWLWVGAMQYRINKEHRDIDDDQPGRDGERGEVSKSTPRQILTIII